MPVLGLGTNVGDRLANIAAAVRSLAGILRDVRVSPIYESEALLLPGSPEEWNLPFYNIALHGKTALSPVELLRKIKEIEQALGRKDRGRWAPREIDIDLLSWGNLKVELPDLTIPHKGLLERAFALLPLFDVAPYFPAEMNPAFPSQAKRASQDVQRSFRAKLAGLDLKFCMRERPLLEFVGIINVTPDSFSDSGKFMDPARAIEAAKEMGRQGASVVDIGAESTRPGAVAVKAEEEWSRLEPVLRGLREAGERGEKVPKIGVDTRHPDVAIRALEYEICWINDVSGFDSEEMIEAALRSDVDVICMHHLTIPADPKVCIPREEDALEDVKNWGAKRIEKLIERGISPERIIFDPGIGFGKTADQSWKIIRNISRLHELNVPLMVGHSRKSFLSAVTNRPSWDRDGETAAISLFLARQGVRFLRVHNVRLNRSLVELLTVE